MKRCRDKKGLGLKEADVITVTADVVLDDVVVQEPDVLSYSGGKGRVKSSNYSDLEVADIILQENYFNWVREDDEVPLGSQRADVSGVLGNYADREECSVVKLVQDDFAEAFGKLSLKISHVQN